MKLAVTVEDPHLLSEEEYEQHTRDYDGLCLACTEIQDGGVEPDAEGYLCEACGEEQIMGLELALISGLVEIT